jgi:hypothetical protein
LTEVVREFVKEEWGHEDTLLSCLQEGLLVASINYPKGENNSRRVPPEYWRTYSLPEFDILNADPANSDDPIEFFIYAECIVDEEYELFKTIAKAAIGNDTSLIADKLQETVLDTLDIETFDDFDDWFGLVCIFQELTSNLKLDEDKYSVFVLDDDWQHFVLQHAPTGKAKASKSRSGAPRKPAWEFLFAGLVIRIMKQEEKSLNELTGADSMSALAIQLLKWAENTLEPVEIRDLPGTDALARRLASLNKNAYRIK